MAMLVATPSKPTPEELATLFAKPLTPAVTEPVDMMVFATAPERLIATVAVLAVGQVIEWTMGRFAGSNGHVLVIEPDGVICVQQQCDLATLRWFKVPNGEYKIIGKAAGGYKIPAAEIQRQSERFKPKVKKMEEFDSPL